MGLSNRTVAVAGAVRGLLMDAVAVKQVAWVLPKIQSSSELDIARCEHHNCCIPPVLHQKGCKDDPGGVAGCCDS